MKNDISNTLNKLVSYARDNLMLDALDEIYTLNRLAALVGCTATPADADYGKQTIGELLSEVTAASPEVDKRAIIDAILPAPHTVNGYFNDELDRNPKKAFDFLFELYALADCVAQTASGTSDDGYTFYGAGTPTDFRSTFMYVGDDVTYTPRAVGNHVANLCAESDIIVSDIVRREAKYAEAYGGAIVKQLGEDGAYLCCDKIALTSAKVKQQLEADGAVKIALLDYPVPALAFTGIAKNSVASTVAKVAKAAEAASLRVQVACAMVKGALTFYLVFANEVKLDEIIVANDALTACGVFATADLTELVSILEKGTALPSDQMAYKAIYEKIGGVKYGAKASGALANELATKFKAALAAASSADEAAVKALLETAKQ